MAARRPRTKTIASSGKAAEKAATESPLEATPKPEQEGRMMPKEAGDPIPARAETKEQDIVLPKDAADLQETDPATEAPAELETLNTTGCGWVKLGGQEYRFDVVVHVDGSVTKRDKKISRKKRAKYGRTPLTYKELISVLGDDPELIIIGTGQRGKMPITPKAQRLLDTRNSFVGPTRFALDWMETDKRKSVAILHVTK